MQNKYTLRVVALCPKDHGLDVYGCEVTSAQLIECERINEVVSKLKDQKIFQEDLTDKMARELGATVRTVGWHSNIKVEVVCP